MDYEPGGEAPSVKCTEYKILATKDAEAISKAKLAFNYRIGDNSWLSGFVLRGPSHPDSSHRELYRFGETHLTSVIGQSHSV
jgi:hypothetical protein